MAVSFPSPVLASRTTVIDTGNRRTTVDVTSPSGHATAMIGSHGQVWVPNTSVRTR